MLLLIFCIGSILGWFLEITYKIIAGQDPSTAGMSKGPFSITYGFAALILNLVISRISDNIFVIFFSSMFLLTILELISGVILDKVFKITLWDYKGLKLYINKYTSGEFMIVWGMLGVIYLKILEPLFLQLLSIFDINIINTFCIGFCIYMAIDYIFVIISQVKKNTLKSAQL